MLSHLPVLATRRASQTSARRSAYSMPHDRLRSIAKLLVDIEQLLHNIMYAVANV